MSQMHNPCHPGEVLKEALSEISVTYAAKRLGVGRVALSRLLNGATGVHQRRNLRDGRRQPGAQLYCGGSVW